MMMGRTCLALLTVLLLVAPQVTAAIYRYETRPVQLTNGPYRIVRAPDSVKMSDDLVLYSRSGVHAVKDNASGLMLNSWDNGTYVYDISDHREYLAAHEVLDADISGSLVVWREKSAIVVHNYLNDSRTVLPVPYAKPIYRPEIDGDRIVWADVRADPNPTGPRQDVDIYLYNLTTMSETRLTDQANASSKAQPDLRGDLVVWNDDRNGDYDIYGYYLTNATEFRVTNETSGQFLPKASNSAVAWLDDRFANDPSQVDIFYKDLGTGREGRASNTGAVESWDISGNRIVWADTSGPDSPLNSGNIMIHDISKNTTKVHYSSNESQYSPAIWGSRVVWVDTSSSGGEIFTMGRPVPLYLGIELYLLLLIPLVVVTVSVILFFKYRMAKENKEIEHYERKSKMRKRGKGLKSW